MAIWKITGRRTVQAGIRSAGLKASVAAQVAARVEAGLILTEAKRRTPVQFGALKASGRIVTRKTGVAIRFGGGDNAGEFQDQPLDYAAAVHERTWVRHANGEAKFLENAVTAAMPGFAGRVAARTKAAMGT